LGGTFFGKKVPPSPLSKNSHIAPRLPAATSAWQPAAAAQFESLWDRGELGEEALSVRKGFLPLFCAIP